MLRILELKKQIYWKISDESSKWTFNFHPKKIE